MKRWMCLAIAAWLLVAWSRSAADFLIIKVDVSKNYLAPAAPQGKGGFKPGVYQPEQSGFQFAAFQPPGQGGPGAYGPGGMYGPGKGFPMFPPGGGAGAGQFPGYGPGQMPGYGGQYMGGGGKGFEFGPKGPNIGGKDPKGKGPFGGGPKVEGPPGKGPFGNLPGWDEAKPRWVYAYLELTSKPRGLGYLPKGSKQLVYTHIEIEHPWGKKCLVPLEMVRLPYDDEKLGYIFKESIPLDFDHRMKKLAQQGKEPVRLLNLAIWALEHGLLKQFHTTMAALSKIEKQPDSVKTALEMYGKAREELKKTPAGDDPALAGLTTDLKKAGYRQLNSPNGHYSLLTNVTGDEALQRRLKLMEETYEKFYYWFALHNLKTLPPVPERRLLTVVVAEAKEFAEKQKAWGSSLSVGDGFLLRRDNVLVMSAEHLEENFALLKKNNQEMIKKISRDALLSGSIWPEGKYKYIKGKLAPQDWARFKEDKKVFDNAAAISYMQTLVLVEKLLATEAERATISHEATRQLLFATGMLPRKVEVPEWIQYGLASFFETPQGAFYPGVGLPSWSNLIDFKYHKKKSKLGTPKDVLLDLVTDRYFLQARESAKRLEASRFRPDHLVNKAKDDREIAHSTAWALVYFLAKEGKLNTLLKYSQELDRLPRDLELSPRVLRGCFTRAYELPDNRLQEIANEWFTAIENTVLEIQEWERDFLNFRLEGSTAGKSSSSETPGGS